MPKPSVYLDTKQMELRPPLIVSPESIPQVRWGQAIRRADRSMNDPIVDEVRRVREALIQQHGGLAGYLKYCEQQDQRRARAAKQRATAKATRSKAGPNLHSRGRSVTAKGHR